MAAMNLGTTFGGKHAVSVAASANGKAHLVYGGADSRIHYRRWNGTVWLEEEILPAPSAKNFHPFVASPGGSPHVVFSSQLGDKSDSCAIFYTRRKARDWSDPVKVSNESSAQLPRLLIDASGVLHVVYDRFGNGVDEIWYARNDGAGWSKTEPVGKGYYPDLAVDANGNVHVLWNDDEALRLRVRAAKGGWGETQKIGGGKKPQTGALAFDSAGNLHHIWQTREADIFSSLTYAKRAPDGALTIAKQVQGAPLKLVFFPRIAVDCMDRVRIVFQGKSSPSGDEPNRVYQRVFDGKSWSDPVRLDAPPLDATSQVPEIHANGTTVATAWINDHPDRAYADVTTISCGTTLGVETPKPATKAKPKPKARSKVKKKPAPAKKVKRTAANKKKS